MSRNTHHEYREVAVRRGLVSNQSFDAAINEAELDGWVLEEIYKKNSEYGAEWVLVFSRPVDSKETK